MRLLALSLFATVVACTDPPPVTDNAAAVTSMGGQEPQFATDPTPAAAASPAPPARAMTPEPMTLEPMVYADFEAADLLGAGCTFHAPDARNIVFVAKSEGGAGVKLDGTVRPLRSTPADYNRMTAGVAASGAGVRLSVTPRPGPGTQSGDSTRDWPATMTVVLGDAAPQTLAGVWQCGS